MTATDERSLDDGISVGWPTRGTRHSACRGGTTTTYSFGDDESKLGQHAWYNKNAWEIGEQYAHRVGQELPNPWGRQWGFPPAAVCPPCPLQVKISRMAPFDPYHKWLGIPLDEQPANYYRLLGIGEFESDADVIDAAAERQTIFLRTFQMGDQVELAERLLNEVSTARVCLLNPRDKGDYDQQLHMEMQSALMPTLTVEQDDPLGIASVQQDMPAWSPPVRELPQRRRTSKPIWQQPRMLAVAGGLVAVILLVAVLNSGGDKASVEKVAAAKAVAELAAAEREGERLAAAKAAREKVAAEEAVAKAAREKVAAEEAAAKRESDKLAAEKAAAETVVTLTGHSEAVTRLAFSPDGKRIVTGSDDKTLKVWNAETGQLAFTLKGYSSLVRSVAFTPDGKQIVSGSDDKTLKIWDAETGQLTLTLKGHEHGIISVSFSPDRKRIVSGGGRGGTLKIWDAKTAEEMLTLKGHSEEVLSVAFSPDGKQIVSGSRDATAKVWDAKTAQQMLTLKGHSHYVMSVAFSPDSKRIVTGSTDKTVKVWDAESGKVILRLNGHSGYIFDAVFSLDGKWIASSSHDRTVRVWDAKTGQHIRTLKGHTARISSVAFSPDGKWLASASDDKTVKLWNLKSETTTPSHLAPQLSKLKNINLPGTDEHPWLSPDGLTIYWDRGDTIWTASRSSAGADFEKPRRLVPGRHPTLSGDQLELIVLAMDDDERPLGMATRSSAEGSFGSVRVIEELRNQPSVKSPALSDDGLTLVFERGLPQAEKRFVVSRRNDRHARWTTPQLLPVDRGPYGDKPWTWASLSQDGLALFCCYGGGKLNRFLVGRRATAGEAFADFQLVQVGNPAVQGRAPRYVKATNELFFSSVPSPESRDSKGDLWVIKNFHPPGR